VNGVWAESRHHYYYHAFPRFTGNLAVQLTPQTTTIRRRYITRSLYTLTTHPLHTTPPPPNHCTSTLRHVEQQQILLLAPHRRTPEVPIWQPPSSSDTLDRLFPMPHHTHLRRLSTRLLWICRQSYQGFRPAGQGRFHTWFATKRGPFGFAPALSRDHNALELLSRAPIHVEE
jgi:hypothetical protein